MTDRGWWEDADSPSHAAMRRAVRLATGAGPRQDATRCPAHVVVLASKIAPVPYELEDFYPANVRSGGVKHMAQDEYDRVKPVLPRRLADYMVVHGAHHDRCAAFAEGRYSEVMRVAAEAATQRVAKAAGLHIFPCEDGPKATPMKRSVPRTYWARYWIQLYLEVVSWLPPREQARPARRLERHKVVSEW